MTTKIALYVIGSRLSFWFVNIHGTGDEALMGDKYKKGKKRVPYCDILFVNMYNNTHGSRDETSTKIQKGPKDKYQNDVPPYCDILFVNIMYYQHTWESR